VKITLTAALLLSGALVAARAGYKNTDREEDGGSAQATARLAQSPVKPPGGWSRVSIARGGRVIQPANREGRIDQTVLDPLEEIVVTVTKPEMAAGQSVFAFTVHGGRINEKVVDTLAVEAGGVVTFRFRAGRYFGDYPVVLRYGGHEEVIKFWVRETKLKDQAEGAP
jgi:hypothetical protein